MEIFYGKNFKFKSHVSFLLLRVIRPVFQSINARSDIFPIHRSTFNRKDKENRFAIKRSINTHE